MISGLSMRLGSALRCSVFVPETCVSHGCLLHISRSDLWRVLYEETEMRHQRYNDAKILEESERFREICLRTDQTEPVGRGA